MSESTQTNFEDTPLPLAAEIFGVAGETPSESVASPVTPAAVYDANATQTVYVDVYDDDEQKFQVEHEFKSHSDEHFFQFDEKRETLLKANNASKKIRMKNRATAAYLWFWDLFCMRVAGYGDPNQPHPENWRELVPDDDKIKAVDGLFVAQIKSAKLTNKEFLSWARNKGKDYRLQVLFDGEFIEVEHRLGAKTAEIVSDWNDLTGSVEFSTDNNLLDSNQEMSLPATAREKVPFYDRLADGEPVGYRGRIPAFVKLLIVNDYLASKSQTAKKPIRSAAQ